MQTPLFSALLLRGLVATALTVQVGVAQAVDIQVNGELQILAERIQSKLPRLSTDKLMEARRTKQGWEYRLRVAEAKTWTEELEIQLIAAERYTQTVSVRLFRREGSLVGEASRRELAEPARWVQEVKAILNE